MADLERLATADIRLLNKKSVTLANPGVQHYIAPATTLSCRATASFRRCATEPSELAIRINWL
jgi:hypothetical protein